jgi:Ring finger domain
LLNQRELTVTKKVMKARIGVAKYHGYTLLLVLSSCVLSTNNGLIQVVHAQLGNQGSSFCRINDEPLQILSYDAVQGIYVLLDENTTINQTFPRRHERLDRHLRRSNHYQFAPQLADESNSVWRYMIHGIRSLFRLGNSVNDSSYRENYGSTAAMFTPSQSKRRLSRNAAMDLQIPENDEYIQAYECDCAGRFQPQEYSFYCPSNKHFCSVSRSSPPLCINAPTASTYLAVNLKLFAITSLTVLIVWLCVSSRGNYAIAFCGSHLCPCYFKEWYLNFLIKHRPTLVSKILRGWIEERQDRLEARYRELQRLNGDFVPEDFVDVNNEPLPPLDPFEESLVREVYESRPSLLLKTRIYKKVPRYLSNATSSGVETGSSSDSSSPHVRNTLDTDSPEVLVACSKDHHDVCTSDIDDSSRIGCDRDDSCMICFATVLEGERVGIMPNCEHIFHSKCLKDWLRRRNVCPLCLDANVAVFSSSPRSKKSQTEQSPLADDRQSR